jgi:hypothetical protein
MDGSNARGQGVTLLRGHCVRWPVESAAAPAAERRQNLATGASPWKSVFLCIQPRQGRKIQCPNLTPLRGWVFRVTSTPPACAWGSIMSPLRGWATRRSTIFSRLLTRGGYTLSPPRGFGSDPGFVRGYLPREVSSSRRKCESWPSARFGNVQTPGRGAAIKAGLSRTRVTSRSGGLVEGCGAFES